MDTHPFLSIAEIIPRYRHLILRSTDIPGADLIGKTDPLDFSLASKANFDPLDFPCHW